MKAANVHPLSHIIIIMINIIGWDTGAVVSIVTSQQGGSMFKPAGQLGSFSSESGFLWMFQFRPTVHIQYMQINSTDYSNLALGVNGCFSPC